MMKMGLAKGGRLVDTRDRNHLRIFPGGMPLFPPPFFVVKMGIFRGILVGDPEVPDPQAKRQLIAPSYGSSERKIEVCEVRWYTGRR
jgi:hypothetical protein